MNTLIELKFPYSFSAGIMENGIIRVCDGRLFKEVDGKIYRPGYLKETSTIRHEANLLKGGDLEAISDYVVDIVDDNLLSTLEMAGYSLNSGEVQVYLLDDTGTKTPIWFGYITGTELAKNTLSIKCENLTKALKTLEKPVILGDCKNVKLERDTTLSNKAYRFLTNKATNYTSKHPIIVQVDSPKYSGATISYGVNRLLKNERRAI